MTKPTTTELQKLQKAIVYEDTFSCVQCGYCLPVCPTYETMGSETYSPRGRIHLVKMVAEGKLKDYELLSDSIDTCLGCRACETACPTGVQYGNIYESAKNVIEQQRQRPRVTRGLRNLLFKYVFPNKKLLNLFSALLWIYQQSQLEKAVNKLRINHLLPGGTGAFAAILPRQTSPWKRSKRPEVYKPVHKPSYNQNLSLPVFRVAFFTGCIMDAMFEKTNRLSMELLQAAGCEVVQLKGETCCGALHAHAGELDLAKEMAKRNIMALENTEKNGPIDFVINNAGGCGAMLVEYDHLLRDEKGWMERAQYFSSKSKDISEVLIQAKPLPFQQSNLSEDNVVTYQRSCHMTHVQKSVASSLQLLKSVPGTTLQEMPDKDKCCGSAGIYNIVNYDESMDILDVKMNNVGQTAAKTIITTNPGCLLQMQLGIKRANLQNQMRAVHLIDYLAEACVIQ